MLRTVAVLLLLLGLATVTPVVCLCAPSEAAGLMAGVRQSDRDGAGIERDRIGLPATQPGDPSLLAMSAAAVVASLVATAAGVRPAAPWQLPMPLGVRWLPVRLPVPGGSSPAPTVPPPR
jgi:hypothetical protein